MKNQLLLQNKSQNLILCHSCQFFPTYSQLQTQTQKQSVFQIHWSCPYCNTSNTSPTDNTFMYYCLGRNSRRMLIDRTVGGICGDTVMWIDVGFGMVDGLVVLRGGRKGQGESKKSMMEESGLLRVFLEEKSLEVRNEKGRYFSWEHFVKQRQLTKIEYALWLSDKLKAKIPNLKVQFYFDESSTHHALPPNFLPKASKLHNIDYHLKSLSTLFTNIPQTNQLLLITHNPTNPLLQLASHPHHPHTLLLNLQPPFDPITLQPIQTTPTTIHKIQNTTYAEGENRGNVRVVGVGQCQVGVGELYRVVLGEVMGDCRDVGVFGRKAGGKSKSKSGGGWQKIIGKQPPKSQPGSPKSPLFTSHPPPNQKPHPLITHFQTLTNNQTTIPQQALHQYLQNMNTTLNTNNKYTELRIYLRYGSTWEGRAVENRVMWRSQGEGQGESSGEDEAVEYFWGKGEGQGHCEECRRFRDGDDQSSALYEEL